MIGQHKNLMMIQKWIKGEYVPKFIIIEGIQGSGRLTFSKELVNKLEAEGIIAENNSIDTVRQIISNAYRNSSTMAEFVYIFRDVDDMSISAKNALLKVVEECPGNAYFIMTVENIETVPSTLRSRATIVKMEHYSEEELRHFTDDEDILYYAKTPLECKIDKEELNDTKCLVDSIIYILEGNGKGVDLLRCSSKLKNKDTDEGVDCKLFFRVLMRSTIKARFSSNYITYLDTLNSDMRNKSTNKKAALESFLLKVFIDVRENNNIRQERSD